MNNIETFPNPINIKVKRNFILEYVEEDEIGEDIIPTCHIRRFAKGEQVIAVSKVKCSKCSSGYGFIIYDEEIEEAHLLDIDLFEVV